MTIHETHKHYFQVTDLGDTDNDNDNEVALFRVVICWLNDIMSLNAPLIRFQKPSKIKYYGIIHEAILI